LTRITIFRLLSELTIIASKSLLNGNQLGWIKFRILPVDGKTLFISEAAIQQ